jgi:hypothetical protein
MPARPGPGSVDFTGDRCARASRERRSRISPASTTVGMAGAFVAPAMARSRSPCAATAASCSARPTRRHMVSGGSVPTTTPTQWHGRSSLCHGPHPPREHHRTRYVHIPDALAGGRVITGGVGTTGGDTTRGAGGSTTTGAADARDGRPCVDGSDDPDDCAVFPGLPPLPDGLLVRSAAAGACGGRVVARYR